MNAIRKAILTGLGSGYLPASGTWGSAIACAVYLAAAYGLRAWGSDLSAAAAGTILNLVMLAMLVLASALCVAILVALSFARVPLGLVSRLTHFALAFVLLNSAAIVAFWYFAIGKKQMWVR
jgi:hypothetical protein